MIGAALGAVVGLVGAGLQAQAQANQLAFQYAHFQWEKQRANTQDRFAQASRGDMYGNVTGYDPIRNRWDVTLTPDQEQIRDATEKEQLLQLTEDAPAARKIKRAVQQRAYEAKEPFNKAQLAYQYRQPASEASIRSEIATLMANNEMQRSKADQALIMRSAMRMGTGADPTQIIKATNQQLGDPEKMRNRMLEARKMAIGERAQRLQQHELEFGTPMKVWGDMMAQGGDIPGVSKSNIDQSLNSMINSQAQGMMAAHQAGTRGVSSAFDALAKAAGQSPDLSSVASAFSKMQFGGAGKGKQDDTYDPTINQGGFSSYGLGGGAFDDRGSEGWD